jgi:purine-nucleoside phosphorylase
MTEGVAEPARVAVSHATDLVRRRLNGRRPTVAVVLGSGLGFLEEKVEAAIRIPYEEIPGFPRPTVPGHEGRLVSGRLSGRDVLVQSGRFHMYEGHSAETCALPVRVFASIGVRTLILTNAAGGIRRTFAPGTLMLIADHVNLTFRNPLTGPVFPGEERFPDMSDPYDRALREIARQVARRRHVALDEGVYAGLLGPSYETPAEVRMLERLGIDAVGMSTVVEVIAARARGISCLGISTVTNAAAGIGATKLSHREVMEAAEAVKDDLAGLIQGIIGDVSGPEPGDSAVPGRPRVEPRR